MKRCQAISLGVSILGDLGLRATYETDPVRADDLKDAMTNLAVLLANGQYRVPFVGTWADLRECDRPAPPPKTPGEWSP